MDLSGESRWVHCAVFFFSTFLENKLFKIKNWKNRIQVNLWISRILTHIDSTCQAAPAVLQLANEIFWETYIYSKFLLFCFCYILEKGSCYFAQVCLNSPSFTLASWIAGATSMDHQPWHIGNLFTVSQPYSTSKLDQRFYICFSSCSKLIKYKLAC